MALPIAAAHIDGVGEHSETPHGKSKKSQRIPADVMFFSPEGLMLA
jgi:hypothetical protein